MERTVPPQPRKESKPATLHVSRSSSQHTQNSQLNSFRLFRSSFIFILCLDPEDRSSNPAEPTRKNEERGYLKPKLFVLGEHLRITATERQCPEKERRWVSFLSLHLLLEISMTLIKAVIILGLLGSVLRG